MAKKHVHSVWSKIKPLNPWYLLGLSIICGLICVTSMRQNNLTMIKLRDQVFAADKANGDVEKALRDLRGYIYGHMNTNLNSGSSVKPPIQLKYRYDRLVQAEQQRLNGNSNQVYTDAQHYCEKLYPSSFSGGPRVPCIKNYVSSHGGAEPQTIPDSLYKFDFVSPSWTPDLAGWSLLLTIVLFIAFLIRLGLEKWVKHDLSSS
jgi:hypothetical protein